MYSWISARQQLKRNWSVGWSVYSFSNPLPNHDNWNTYRIETSGTALVWNQSTNLAAKWILCCNSVDGAPVVASPWPPYHRPSTPVFLRDSIRKSAWCIESTGNRAEGPPEIRNKAAYARRLPQPNRSGLPATSSISTILSHNHTILYVS